MFRYRIDDRLELRQLVPADAGELFALTEANREHLRRWLPWLDTVKAPADTLAFIHATMRQAADRQGFNAGILCGGSLAGIIGHHRISWPNRSTSRGYWLDRGHEGRGIMSAACRAIVRHAFEDLGLNRVEIRCATGNTRSCAIPERLGFRREGLLREAEWLYDRFVDHVVYALLRREWDPAA